MFPIVRPQLTRLVQTLARVRGDAAGIALDVAGLFVGWHLTDVATMAIVLIVPARRVVAAACSVNHRPVRVDPDLEQASEKGKS